MGVDLRLLPLDSDSYGSGYSHTVLNVHRDSALWDRIEAQHPKPLAESHRIMSHVSWKDDGERGYGALANDAYGNRYAWVTAGELLQAFDETTGPAWTVAYVKALPPDTRIILDWH